MSRYKQHFFDELVYDMDYKSMGVCLIINNENLEGRHETKTRKGSGKDADAAVARFKELGFQVRVKQDLGAVDMLQCIEKVASEDHSRNSCFVLVLLTEGRSPDSVCGADFIEIPVEDIMVPFKGKNCEGLIGKPKIFIIEAGRGEGLDSGVEQADATVCAVPEAPPAKIPEEADVICAFSTVPGYVSWRTHTEGSWFIQELCRVLEKHADAPFLLLLDHVNHLVARGRESNTRKEVFRGKKQMPQLVSQLTKTLYLREPKGDGF